MKKALAGAVLGLGVVALLLVQVCACAKPERKSFRELIRKRPAPDLERLADRSAPGLRGEDTGEAFYDILKLRETGDPRAVPVLQRILDAHVDSTRIHGFAAAQALFCTGTPEAHEILSKYLLSCKYPVESGINYTYHWEMPEPERSRFIEQYHLRNLSTDLQVTLERRAPTEPDATKHVFVVTLKNISSKPFRVRKERVYIGRHLVFRSEDGRYARSAETVMYMALDVVLPPAAWPELAPGSTCEFEIAVTASRIGQLKGRRWPKLSENAKLFAHTKDMAYDIVSPSRFRVYALYAAQPLSKKQIQHLGFDNAWSGRAIAEPITVEIKAP